MKLSEQTETPHIVQTDLIGNTTVEIADNFCSEASADEGRKRIEHIKQIYLNANHIRIVPKETEC